MQRQLLLVLSALVVALMLLSPLATPAQATISAPAPISPEETPEWLRTKGSGFKFPDRFPLASQVAPEIFERYTPSFKIDPALLELLKDPNTVKLDVIVQYDPSSGFDLSTLPPSVHVKHTFWGLVPFFAAELPADRAVLEALANVNGVVAVYRDAVSKSAPAAIAEILPAPSGGAAGLPRIESPWMFLMNETLEKIHAKELWDRGYTGMGVVVAVLDTGITKEFPNFYFPEDFPRPEWRLKNKIIDEVSFVPGEGPEDLNGRGTAVAHIIGSTGRTGGRIRYYDYDTGEWKYAYLSPEAAKGVAPGCFLMNLKCVNSDLDFQDSWVIAALVYAIRHGADVIVCDFLYEWWETIYPADWHSHYPVFYTIEWCVQNGAVVILPAGNEGPGYGTIATPGNLESVITVGATTEYDTVAPWSSRGTTTAQGLRGLPFPITGPAGALRTKPDIVAPGEMIVTSYYDWAS
ncbi:S8 family serine peptidase, partial [archaeon]|nr:S8 family serine peptidase [archaeon]